MDFVVISWNKRLHEYHDHSHEYWEILLNLEGSGTAVLDGREYPFHPGTIFCIRPGVIHRKKARDGFVDGSILIRDFCFEKAEENVLVFEDDERSSFKSLFNVALEFPLNPATDVYAERFLRSVLDAMQNLLCHWRDATGRNPEVLRVQKLLADHVKDPGLDLDAMIRGTSYSPNHFRKLFREQCGCSPMQYYNQLRVQMAKQQILQYKSVLSVSEIARNCGFEDPYYFSRLFKKVSGLSPMQFYKESRKTITRYDE